MQNVYDAGVDWLTLTWKKESPDFDRVQNITRNILHQMAGSRENLKSENWQGYKGVRTYGIFAGERDDGFCVRASGSDAKKIAEEFKQHNIRGNASRIDLQITAQDGHSRSAGARRVQAGIRSYARKMRSERAISLATYSRGGRALGCTVGSRSSDRYSRFYNKTEEQRGKVAPGLWRFEVEFKGEQARQVHGMVRASASPYWLSCSLVKAQFESYGADMTWLKDAPKMELPSQARTTDAERQLNWLRKPIAGVVRKLIEQGYEAEIREILGLP